MGEFQEQLKEFQEWEIKALLNEILNMTAHTISKGNDAESILANGIMKLCDNYQEEARKRRMEAEEHQSGVHIVFSLSNAGSLKVTLSEIGKRQENKVLAFNDLFSIGPMIETIAKIPERKSITLWCGITRMTRWACGLYCIF